MNQQAVCSCIQGYIGSPPLCHPECTTNSECSPNQACLNQKCQDPCPGTCGINAKCSVVNHTPFCSCPDGHRGNPFTSCQSKISHGSSFDLVFNGCKIVGIPVMDIIPTNPCELSPCGPNSECRVIESSPSCSCLSGFTGSPPNCRPECVVSSECPSNLACINQKCKDPCPGLCGINAVCKVVSHTPVCLCQTGFSGDPFVECNPRKEILVADRIDPCNPNPCGANAVCKTQNGAGSCQCLPDYFGNPYENCRPECIINSDCASNKACVQNKCKDPCPGTCGRNSECQVINHIPTCACLTGYTGDPYRICNIIYESETEIFLI